MRAALAVMFFCMSPFFPWNNGLELIVIGALASVIHPLLPFEVDLGLLRSLLYLVYNIIAIVGLVLSSPTKIIWTWKIIAEIFISLGLLFLSGIVPEPYGTGLLVFMGVYFLSKLVVHRIRNNR